MPAQPFRPTSDANRRAVGLFLAYLTELPLADWIAAARRRADVPGMVEAEQSLHVLERQLDHAGQIFAVKEGVLRVLHQFATAEGRRLTRVRQATEHLRPATENTALAVLLRQGLRPDQFITLYAPFEEVIPAALLFGLTE